MALSDAALIAWLVIFDYEDTDESSFTVPHPVRDALVARGWLTLSGQHNWKGQQLVAITPAGRAQIDINAADFGLDTALSEVTDGEE